MVTDTPIQENDNYKTVSYYQKAADMRNAEENHQAKFIPKFQETKPTEFEEVEVFRAIAQEYFPEEIDRETETIPRDLNTEESEWEDYSTDEYEIWECKLDKELTTSEIEHKRYLQDLLIELAIEAEIEITWSTQNGYQYEPVSHSNLESNPQPILLNEAYQIDIPLWGEIARGLEFENNDEE
ncbi:26337_t:CDS:1 [Dentiscutata erythropus]|uniref:26337_t:CDS:1 n=1 Tax=Dentiscutata erythropus TaxID=1348616 RepID=A0A9N8WH25_9GLOM|nr:26337_t:CDS:1 [Dentiscutata erythropus]